LAFFFTISTLILPESPRWLSQSGKHQEATSTWEKLGVLATEREKHEEDASRNSPKHVEWKDILAIFHRNAWKQTAIGVFLMGMQQASGIDGVLYVSTNHLVRELLIDDNSMRRYCSRPQDSQVVPLHFLPLAFLLLSFF
jgi:hypothetical protein